uniref:Parvin alpha n=1 Tax=Sus scrofa TaxID=9823 RepID=A0A8D0K7X1_PIG
MNAINLPLSPIPFELDPEDTMLEENEVRTMVDPNSRSDPKLQELMKVLIDWINDVLVGERIIVKDLAEDLYDGQVLQKLFEKLESEKLNVAEVTQSEIAQKQKLQTVLEKINETLKLPPRSIKWNVDSVHAKSLVAILHLLVALSQYFRAPIRLPDHVSIQVVVVQKREGILQSRQIQEEITGNTEALSGRHERDAFDTLFDHAPDKLNVVKKVGKRWRGWRGRSKMLQNFRKTHACSLQASQNWCHHPIATNTGFSRLMSVLPVLFPWMPYPFLSSSKGRTAIVSWGF